MKYELLVIQDEDDFILDVETGVEETFERIIWKHQKDDWYEPCTVINRQPTANEIAASLDENLESDNRHAFVGYNLFFIMGCCVSCFAESNEASWLGWCAVYAYMDRCS